MFTSTIVVIPALVAQLAAPAPHDASCRFERLGDADRDAQAITAFVSAVDQYAELHRRLARPLAPLRLWSDVQQADTAAAALREALRDARPHASVGRLFTPEVADVLRFRIRQAVIANGYDAAAMASDAGEGEQGAAPILIGMPLPWGSQERHWPAIEEALPLLPLELAYAFVGRDLVLVDVDADMVVDVLELALPLH